MSSWQLAHLSSLIPAGDYESQILPEGARWGARPVVVMGDGILSVQHTLKHRDAQHWVLAGGGVEDGETISQAAIRELQEEAHVTIAIEHLLYVRIFYFEHPVVEFYPLATIQSGTPSLGHDPESPPDYQILTDIRTISFDELENDEELTFYPTFLRKRIRQDIQTPPTKALYVGTTP